MTTATSAARAILFRVLLLLLVLISVPNPCIASDFNAPHAHTGKVSPFTPGDPKVPLNGKARSILSSGKPYQTTIYTAGSTSGRGLVVQDVHAPTDVVWDRILDYDHYADMVPKTAESKNYKVVQHKPTKKDPLAQTIYTRMKVGLPLIPKMTFFVKHLYYPQLNSLTWTLDYTKKSDFDDSVGYWYVVPHPELPNWTRLYYSVSVSMPDWVPNAVLNFMSTKALTDATGWVKKFSEERWQQDPRRAAAEAEKKSLIGALLARLGKHDGGDTDGVSTASDTCDSSVDTCDSVEVLSINIPTLHAERGVQDSGKDDNKPSKIVSVKAAWIRIALIMTVSSLFVYNISLCLDRWSQ